MIVAIITFIVFSIFYICIKSRSSSIDVFDYDLYTSDSSDCGGDSGGDD